MTREALTDAGSGRTETVPPVQVGVFLPVFNGEAYLLECLESILCQTYSHLQVVAVDDGSTDGSLGILQSVAGRDPRLEVVRLPRNQGTPVAANLAFSKLATDWCIRMDQDDVMLPDCVAQQLEIIRRYPDAAVVSGRGQLIGPDGRAFGRTMVPALDPDAVERCLASGTPLGLTHPGTAIRRGPFLAAGGYDPALWPGTDLDLWTRLAEAGHRIVTHQGLVVKRRIHSESTFSRNQGLVYLRSEWSMARLHARRAGQAEPAWERFLADRASLPGLVRLRRAMQLQGDVSYRRAGIAWLERRVGWGIVWLLLASLLHPGLVLTKLRAQFRR